MQACNILAMLFAMHVMSMYTYTYHGWSNNYVERTSKHRIVIQNKTIVYLYFSRID